MRYAVLRSGDHEAFVRVDASHDTHAFVLDAPPWQGGKDTGRKLAFSAQDLRCPVRPSKIVCVGRNYAKHARELGQEVPSEPLLFLKPPSSLIGPGDAVRLPADSRRVEYEAELTVVIGQRTKDAAPDATRKAILGYTCACDVTARDLQRKDVQFTRAKGFDTFCPVGPWIETDLDPTAIAVRCRVNGETRQDGTTADMLFDVPTLVAYISRVMTLEPGDIILTGTPDGVGPVSSGDRIEVDIGGIGVLAVGVET